MPPDTATRCARCNFSNPQGMRFCGGCGSPLAAHCADCGFENPPGFRFCGQCGASLTGEPPPPPPPPPRPMDEGERRQITVLFCDLVGSTLLSDRLDPEELRELVREYQTVSGEVIERYEGYVAQYLGDGLLVYFGYPQAHEDDARRALRAGLEIIEAVSGLNAGRKLEQRLSVRMGVHTGFGVAGAVGGRMRREQLVIGRTPNIAARLQSLAEPDTVVISESTRRLVEGYFVFESLGVQALKGIAEPMEVLRVVSESRGSERFQGQRHLSPLVDREEELRVMEDLLERSRGGSGQVLLLMAEPGLGKSRLVHTLEQRVAGQCAWLIGRCSPYAQTSALRPVVELFQQLLGLKREEPEASRLARLSEHVARGGLEESALPLLSEFFSLPLPVEYRPLVLSPQKRREHTRLLLIQLLLAQARHTPVVLVLEDLHWADPSSLEFITECMEAASTAPVLTVLTARPSFQAPWMHAPYLTQLSLSRLEDEQAARIIQDLTGGRSLPAQVLRQLLDKADGVPLFVEELTRSTLESGLLTEREGGYELARPLEPLSIPATLRDSLMARLDRLGPVKDVVQLASAIGRSFSYELLVALSPIEPRFLRLHLEKLLESGLLLREEAAGRLEVYRFRHALIQDAAYESILKSRRREVHAAIARALEDRFPEVVESRPEVMARHCEEAGQAERAARYLHLAGQEAMQRAAYAEAMAVLTHAIGLCAPLAESKGRDRLELELRTSMAGALVVTRGYCAPELEQCCVRSRELCARLGDPPELVPVLYTLWVVNLAASRRGPTEGYARQLVDFVRTVPEPMHELTARFAHATTLFYLGLLEEARTGYLRALQHYEPERHSSLARVYGDDHGIYSQVYLEWLYMLVGETERALEMKASTLAQAERLHDPLSQAQALVFAMIVHHGLREPEAVQEYAERAMAVCTEQGFPFWGSLARCGHGLLLVQRGEHAEGIRQIEQGLGFLYAIQQKLPLTYWLSYLVEAHLVAGQHEQGLVRVEEALGLAEANVDRFYLPELWRLKGELLWARGRPASTVLECFERALTVAHECGAAFLELKAAHSMARLLAQQGERVRAREVLSAAVTRLREGHGTVDYREARQLLEELGR